MESNPRKNIIGTTTAEVREKLTQIMSERGRKILKYTSEGSSSDDFPRKVEPSVEPPTQQPHNVKSVLKYSLDGNFLQEYTSIDNAAEGNKTFARSIGEACVGKRFSSHGFIWRFKTGDFFPQKLDIRPEQKLITKLHRIRTRAVVKCDMDGIELQRFDSIQEAAKSMNTCHSVITRVCLGERKSAMGFKWKYETPTENLLRRL